MTQCSYCSKPIRKRSWIGFIGDNIQCDRLWCRIKTGHFLLMNFGLRIKWTPVIILKIPLIRK